MKLNASAISSHNPALVVGMYPMYVVRILHDYTAPAALFLLKPPTDYVQDSNIHASYVC